MNATTRFELFGKVLPALGIISALGFTASCSSTPEFRYDTDATVISHSFLPEHVTKVTECEVYDAKGFCTALTERTERVPDTFSLLLEECDAKAEACARGSVVVEKVLYDQIPDGATVTIDETGSVTV